MKFKGYITITALLIYIVLFLLAWINSVLIYYAADIFFSIAFTLFLHFAYRFWRLSRPVYALVVLSLTSHLMGIFGWYNTSPIPLSWDHITHGLPMFSFTLLIYGFMHQWMDRKYWKAKTWAIMILVLLSAMGIGAAIENVEFLGFLTVGYGEGALFFGGAGDVTLPATQAQILKDIGGGYWNTELDLLWNLAGALAGIILMSAVYYGFKKKEPSGTVQSSLQEPYPLTSSWRLQ